MPSYRGVEQADLIRTVNDALAMLETHSTGPVMQGHIDGLRKVDANGASKLGALAAAKTDEEFVAAVRGSGLHWLFGRAGDVLQYHAVNDTDGKGAAILQDLVKWNATGGAMTLEYNKLDEETDTWLVLNYARQTGRTEENLEKLVMVMDAVSQNKVAVSNGFLAAVRLVDKTHGNTPDADLKKIFLDLDLHERHIVKTSLSALFTLDGMQGSMAFQPAISRYGVVIDELTAGKVNWTDKSVEAVRMEVEKALSPFYKLDEVEMTGIGLIGDWSKQKPETMPQGVIFQSSARAAQAVADALPGMKVLDLEGHAVPPRKKPVPPKPAFNP